MRAAIREDPPAAITRQLAYQSHRAARPWLCGCTAADLAQEGALGWLRTLARHDAAKAQMTTYAAPRIKGAMVDAVRATTHKGQVRYVPLGPSHAVPPRDEDVLLVRQVRRAVNQLPRRLRYVVIRRYWRGWRQQAVARGLRVSPSRACQMERQALARLGPVLQALVTEEERP